MGIGTCKALCVTAIEILSIAYTGQYPEITFTYLHVIHLHFKV